MRESRCGSCKAKFSRPVPDIFEGTIYRTCRACRWRWKMRLNDHGWLVYEMVEKIEKKTRPASDRSGRLDRPARKRSTVASPTQKKARSENGS